MKAIFRGSILSKISDLVTGLEVRKTLTSFVSYCSKTTFWST